MTIYDNRRLDISGLEYALERAGNTAATLRVCPILILQAHSIIHSLGDAAALAIKRDKSLHCEVRGASYPWQLEDEKERVLYKSSRQSEIDRASERLVL